MNHRYLCIHGHFYQPPRENPWLEAVQIQDSAYPYHDWNERITDECYAQNACSRILDAEGLIERIVNNYARISFNFGPTLLRWMEDDAPETYAAILEADRRSRELYSGHGSALAQAYHHAILPLCNARDRRTEVRWGVRDFERRFGRRPEGMWLPETAVDIDTLETLVEEGLSFTILEPRQARRWRAAGSGRWADVGSGGIDPKYPYVCRLPSGRSISLFFYDGPMSRAVAFEGLLRSGEVFAERLTSAFTDDGASQLVHIATDGETYGHHHRHGDMALAYALRHIESRELARLTNYGEFLALEPPRREVEILPRTAWSCAHGIERWQSDCGCSTGGHPEWSQAWRKPLREGFDWFRDRIGPAWETQAARYLRSPWEARDDYVSALDGDADVVSQFLQRHAVAPLEESDRTAVLELLEMQRHALMMYTSCGWFFEDVAGIETVQVLRYAGRALQLAEKHLDTGLRGVFLERLARAHSNMPDRGDARQIWEREVEPAVVGLPEVAAHFVVSSLFEDYEDAMRIYRYRLRRREDDFAEAGSTRLGVGRVDVVSEVTGERMDVDYAILHLGDHNLTAGVRRFPGEDGHRRMVEQLREAFGRADMPEVIRRIDAHFKGNIYSLRSLFRDEQRRTLERILESSLTETGAEYRAIYQRHGALMRYLVDLGQPLPRAFMAAAELVIHAELRETFETEVSDVDRARDLLREAERLHLELDGAGLAHSLGHSVGRLIRLFEEAPERGKLLEHLAQVAELAHTLPFAVELWDVQNVFYGLTQRVYPERRRRAEAGDAEAEAWCAVFRRLGHALRVRVH